MSCGRGVRWVASGELNTCICYARMHQYRLACPRGDMGCEHMHAELIWRLCKSSASDAKLGHPVVRQSSSLTASTTQCLNPAWECCMNSDAVPETWFQARLQEYLKYAAVSVEAVI